MPENLARPIRAPLLNWGRSKCAKIAQNSDALRRTLAFDPIRLIDRIEPSDDRCLKLDPGRIWCHIEDSLRLSDRRERTATPPVATFGSVRGAI
jgi:hypothetical protein